MTDKAKRARTVTIPTMRYEDAARMIDWLCEAFGFERHLVVPGENGTIAHAQLTLGDGMIMLGSWRDDEWGRLVKTVRRAGAVTQRTFTVPSISAPRNPPGTFVALASAWSGVKPAPARLRSSSCRLMPGTTNGFITSVPAWIGTPASCRRRTASVILGITAARAVVLRESNRSGAQKTSR